MKKRAARRFPARVERFEQRRLLATFTVTDAGDNGSDTSPIPGSLRDVILRSDAAPAPSGQTNQIVFDIDGPSTMAPTYPLPTITAPVVIDGRTQPDTPVVLDGIHLDTPGNAVGGLEVEASGSTFEGLTIDRFPGDGILLGGAQGDLIINDRIGTDPSGETSTDPSGSSLGNGYDGIILLGSSHNTIQGCVISGNIGNGIYAMGAPAFGNLIIGNEIGTDASGTKALPNTSPPGLGDSSAGNGVFLDNAPANTVGGTTAADSNVISGNVIDGVRMYGPGALENVIEGNRIGTDVTGTVKLGNGVGVEVVGGTANSIGGTVAGAGNVISANLGDGVLIQGGSNLVASNILEVNQSNGVEVTGPGSTSDLLQGNLIGLDTHAMSGRGNLANGILIASAPGAHVVDNVISGNGLAGVNADEAPDLVIADNAIGVANDPGTRDGAIALGNGEGGVSLRIPLGAAVVGNTISANGTPSPQSGSINFGLGVAGSGATPAEANSEGLFVADNRIGTDSTGKLARGNLGMGVKVDATSGVTIEDNTISANQFDALLLTGDQAPQVLGNHVGTGVAGTERLGNGGVGIFLDHTDRATAAGNVVVNNGAAGVQVDNDPAPDLSNTSLAYNYIGTDPLAPGGGYAVGLGNKGAGVSIVGASDVTVIGDVIDSSYGGGIVVTGVPGNSSIAGDGLQVLDDFIGTAPSHATDLGNAGVGIYVIGLSLGLIAGNTIGENGDAGIDAINDSNLTIRGNFIGTDADGQATSLGNRGEAGVSIVGYGGVDVENDVVELNTIANNLGVGINIFGTMNSVVLSRNQIGGDLPVAGSSRTVASGNTMGGVGIQVFPLEGKSGTTVEVSSSTIAGNGGDGIDVYVGNSVLVDSYTIVEDNRGNGIEFDRGSTGNTLINTLVQDNRGDGVQFNEATPNTLTGVVIRGNLGKGLHANNSPGIVVTGGAIEDNKGG